MQSTDVLVVGAGPTGLMAANQLQRFGVDFLIIWNCINKWGLTMRL